MLTASYEFLSPLFKKKIKSKSVGSESPEEKLIFVYFFGGLLCVGHSFAYDFWEISGLNPESLPWQ